MAEPDQPDSDPIGYRLIGECMECGLEKATRMDCGYCRECIKNMAPKVWSVGAMRWLRPEDSESADVPSPPQTIAVSASIDCDARAGKRIKEALRADVTAQRHYTATAIEPIEVIEAWNLDRYLTQVMKYIGRHEHKGSAEHDLYKALDWLHRRVYGEWLGKPPPPGVGGGGE